MTDSLATYLHDHFAGSTFAVELLESMRDQKAGTPLTEFAAAMLAEISKDRETLQGIIHRVGEDVPAMKEATAWLGEKASRLKLGSIGDGGLGTFEALEALSLGILGKRSLWQALPVIAEVDTRVAGIECNSLAVRAEVQYARVEQMRLQVARDAFQPHS